MSKMLLSVLKLLLWFTTDCSIEMTSHREKGSEHCIASLSPKDCLSSLFKKYNLESMKKAIHCSIKQIRHAQDLHIDDIISWGNAAFVGKDCVVRAHSIRI